MPPRRHAADDFSHSITDLMTSIAVIFVLLFLFFAQQQRREAGATDEAVDDLMAALRDALEGEVEVDQGTTAQGTDRLTIEITLPERYQKSLTFRNNEAELEPKGQELVDFVVPRLLGVVCEPRFVTRLDSLVVEGHTSTRGDLPLNLRLSTQRATEVVLRSHKLATPAHQFCFEQLTAASGRGPWHLERRKNGEEDEDRSRRVVFRLRVKSLEQRQAEKPK